uniref:MULE transposase domain-containing protein n=1 Tax=Ditylenchus dipsaci TaxID=166011 RepID=A0A915EP55_9BILA
MTMDAKVLGCSSSSMARSYQNYKREASYEEGDKGMDKDDGMEILIPDRLNDKVFIDTILTWYDSRKKQDVVGRIIGFASNFGVRMLNRYPPKAFAQLWNVAVIVERTAIPCVYVLTTAMNELIYSTIMNALKDVLEDNWAPTIVISDFESAALNGVMSQLPQTTYYGGCLFHLAHNVFGKIQAVPSLLNAYNTSEKAREDMKSLYALAFLPISLVYFGFCVLVEETDSDNEGWIGG